MKAAKKKLAKKQVQSPEIKAALAQVASLKTEINELKAAREKTFRNLMATSRTLEDDRVAHASELREARVATQIAKECEQQWRTKLDSAQSENATLRSLLDDERSKTLWQRIAELFAAKATPTAE